MDEDEELECELMIEALQRELRNVKERLSLLLPPSSGSPQAAAAPKQTVGSRSSSNGPPPPPPQAPPPKTEPILDQRLLCVVDERESERAELKRSCLKLMQQHIEAQLVQLQERAARLQRSMRRRQHKERELRLERKPVRFRSTGEDDRSFLDRVYQGSFYQIVSLEHQLRSTGKLQKLDELKDFWDTMLSPPPLSTQPDRPASHDPQETSGEETTNSWAITAAAPLLPGKQPEPGAVSPPPPTESPVFTQMQLPELRPVSDILKARERRLCNAAEQRHKKRSSELWRERSAVQHMYQQARANEMTMRQLLARQPAALELPPLPTPPATADTAVERSEETLAVMTTGSITLAQTEELDRAMEADSNQPDGLALQPHSVQSEPLTMEPLPDSDQPETLTMQSDSVQPEPLTMQSQLQSTVRILESHANSKMWKNYAM